MRKLTRPTVESAAHERGRLNSSRAGEFHFHDTDDYITFVASAVRQSGMYYSHIAKGSGLKTASTVSNLASGKTRLPRFSTITGILGALGYETVIRSERKKP